MRDRRDIEYFNILTPIDILQLHHLVSLFTLVVNSVASYLPATEPNDFQL